MTATFPAALNSYVEREGISWRELMRRTGIDVSTLRDIARGHTTPRPATIKRICRALGWSRSDELRWIDEYSDDELFDALDHT